MSSHYPYDLLFIEDEIAIRQNYVAGLKLMFQNVYEASSAQSGYNIYQEKKPQILIVDIHLPKMSGLELINMIRKKDINTKIIILTAHSDTDYLLQASSLKLVQYLVKPIKRDQLNNALQNAIKELQNFKIEPLKTIELQDDFSWNMQTNELFHLARKINLSKKEQQFLKLLFSSTSQTFTYEKIFEEVWGLDDSYSIDKIKSLVRKLRKKIPHTLIENIYGIGFKIHIS